MDVAARLELPPQRLRHFNRRWLALGGVALLLVSGTAIYRLVSRPGAVSYSTAVVGTGTITKTVSASGTVNPVLTITVGTYVSGVIEKLYCDFNTQVKAGQICAKIDPRPYQVIVAQDRAALATAKAQLEKDKANLNYLKQNHERLAWLVERNSAAQDAADLARSAYDQGQAQVQLDQATVDQRAAELQAAEVNLGYTDITSPVDGVVVARNVTQGQTVAASFQTPTLFLIATDLTAMQVDSNVSESDIGLLKPGQVARFTVEAHPQRQFEGRVTQIRQAPQTVQNVVTYDVIVGVNNAERLLLPGMTATLRIITAERTGVLRVPDQALRYIPSVLTSAAGQATVSGGEIATPSQRVWVLRDGRPQAEVVQTGLDDDSYTEVISGNLRPGDRVIIGEGPAASVTSPTRPPRFGL